MFLYSLLLVQLKAILEMWGRCLRENTLFHFSTLTHRLWEEPKNITCFGFFNVQNVYDPFYLESL